MKKQISMIVTALVILVSSNAFADHCTELAPKAVAKIVSRQLEKKGLAGIEIQTMVGSYNPNKTIVLATFASEGTFAYKVKTHYIGSNCVIDSVKPTLFIVSRHVSHLKF